MKYTSQNGCFFYYDRDTFNWELCEPTLMFLLGFEAITMFDKSSSDSIVISNKIYDTKTGVVDDMPDFPIYDEAISYLASLGQVEDGEYYARYNCYGLKLLMNELTGTGTDRTVPVIFLNDINRKLVDPNKYPYSDKAGKSYYDLQSTLILNVFKYAGYNLQDNEIVKVSTLLAGRDPYNIANTNVPPLLDEIVTYNSSVTTLHEEKQAAGGVYKLLDYKAMYLYSLGVLYGLRCMGYDGQMIWRFDPAYWYFDKYQNLVKTAWAVFRFHYSHPIYELDTSEELIDKYKAIQYNKLWNFMNDEDSSDIVLYDNEVFAYAVHVDPVDEESYEITNRVAVKPLIYLYPTDDEARNGDKGKYIVYLSDDKKWSDPKSVDGNESASDNIVSSTEPYKGVISVDSDNYVRYIANDKVNIRKALRYTRNIPVSENSKETLSPRYLSPNGNVLCTIPEDTELEVLDVDDKYYKVFYDVDGETVTGWINRIYTDIVAEDIDFDAGDFLTELFDINSADEAQEHSLGRVVTNNSVLVRSLPGNDWSYFISTGNFGWTDFDLTYWKKFKKYIRDEYDDSDVGQYLKDQDAETSSVLAMEPHDFKYLYPERIGSAFSSVDGTTVSYYKCNVTDDTYLYGIFDGYLGEDENGDPTFGYYVTNGNSTTYIPTVKPNFKYILSSVDFYNIFSSVNAPDGYVKKCYYNVTDPVWIYVKNATGLPQSSPTLWDGAHEIRIDKFGYTHDKANKVDAYYYEWPIRLLTNSVEPSGPTQFDLRSFKLVGNDTYYWSNEFVKQTDTTDPEYPYEYTMWVKASSSIIKKSITRSIGGDVPSVTDEYDVYATTGESVTLYRNVRKLFDNTPYYYKLDYSDGNMDYICNANKNYANEFSPYLPLGFVRYTDLHSNLGVTTYMCPIVERDTNGDSLIIDGVPYVWQDPYTSNSNERYWNGFQNKWQADMPVRRNAMMFVIGDPYTVGELVPIIDDTENRTVIIDDGVTLTYEEFYANPNRGILRDHDCKVFSEDYEDEGIVDCYYDTKLLDDGDEHLICVPGRTRWVKRSELKNPENHRYWIVDGTTSLYDGTDAIRTVYDDEHKD